MTLSISGKLTSKIVLISLIVNWPQGHLPSKDSRRIYSLVSLSIPKPGTLSEVFLTLLSLALSLLCLALPIKHLCDDNGLSQVSIFIIHPDTTTGAWSLSDQDKVSALHRHELWVLLLLLWAWASLFYAFSFDWHLKHAWDVSSPRTQGGGLGRDGSCCSQITFSVYLS